MGIKESRTAATNVYRVARNLEARLKAIHALHDPDLSAEGLNKAKDERTKSALAAAKAKSQAYVQIARDGRDVAESRVAEHRPKVDLNDVALLTRTAQTWEMIVKPMRDKGLNWSEIAAAADWETLHALARFAEQTVKLEDPNDASVILRNLDLAMNRRTAEIHPDETARELFQEAAEAEAALTAANSMAVALDNAYSPQGVQSALIFGMRSLHPMGLLPTEPALTNEQQDHLTGLIKTHGVNLAANTIAGESGVDIASSALPV